MMFLHFNEHRSFFFPSFFLEKSGGKRGTIALPESGVICVRHLRLIDESVIFR